MATSVLVSKKAAKALLKSPLHVQQKFALWQIKLETEGLRSTRKILGFHDEPLQGTRKGERSIRLSILWRAIYVESSKGEIEFGEVIEVTPHAY